MAADDDPVPASTALCEHCGVRGGRPRLHDAKETSRLLGGVVTPNWLKRKAGRRLIPHTRIGQTAAWSDSDIERLIAENYCDPRTYGRKRGRSRGR